MMKEIPFLKLGSKIAIAAPARMVKPEEMQYAINWLKEKGFVPVYDDRLFAGHHIFAGDDDFRAFVFQQYLEKSFHIFQPFLHLSLCEDMAQESFLQIN